MSAKRIIQITGDGSHTIAVPDLNITYHSKYGAMQESMHVFIQTGLQYFLKLNNIETLCILEVGFGTGLNALLTLNEATQLNQKIFYQAIEPFPVSIDEANALNYAALINPSLKEKFLQLHNGEFDNRLFITDVFSFKKINDTLENYQSNQKFHLIYFDAFDPNAQPELWKEAIFKKLYKFLYKNGMIVTYCSKSIVQKALLAAGFSVEKLKGPPHKREIIRAVKAG